MTDTLQKSDALSPQDVPGVQVVISRFCALVELVSDKVFGNDYPTDCFCGEGGFWPLREEGSWKHDLDASVAFIERATEVAMARFAEARPDPKTWSP